MEPMTAKKSSDEGEALTVVLAVNVSPSMAEELDEEAYRLSEPGAMVSRAEVVRRACRAWLDKRRR